MWGFPKIRGTILGGPYNKDCNILGSVLGSPYLGKLPCGGASETIALLMSVILLAAQASSVHVVASLE